MSDYELTELAVVPFECGEQEHFDQSDDVLATVDWEAGGYYVVFHRRDVPTDFIYWSPYDPDVTEADRERILDAVNGSEPTLTMQRDVDYDEVAEWLRDEKGYDAASADGIGDYVDIGGNQSLLGHPTTEELFTDLHVVPQKVLHSSQISGSFAWDEGYRVWFASIEAQS